MRWAGLLLLLAVGCSSPRGTVASRDAAAQKVEEVPPSFAWSPVFLRAKATIAFESTDAGFQSAFIEGLASARCPFELVDPAAVEKARQRRAALAGDTPAEASLDAFAPDFIVAPRFTVATTTRHMKGTLTDVESSEHDLAASARVTGGRSRNGIVLDARIEYTTSTGWTPVGRGGREVDRQEIADLAVLLAKKLVLELSRKSASAAIETTITFKGWPLAEHPLLESCVKTVAGEERVETQQLPESDTFRVRMTTRRELEELKEALQAALAERVSADALVTRKESDFFVRRAR